MMVDNVMDEGKHTISFRLIQGNLDEFTLYCGAVSTAVSCFDNPTESSCPSWLIDCGGFLYGSGKDGDDGAGQIENGQILTIQVDLDEGFLSFWKDGIQHGPGFSAGVVGPIHWAVCVVDISNAVQIISTPVLQPLEKA
jgi:hypothetical protein